LAFLAQVVPSANWFVANLEALDADVLVSRANKNSTHADVEEAVGGFVAGVAEPVQVAVSGGTHVLKVFS
jgi:hypothetical protein